MPEETQQAPDSTCRKRMSDGEPCGRPALPFPEGEGVNRGPVCLMHSHDPNKDVGQFDQEIQAILGGTSQYRRSEDLYAFSGFVFLSANFSGATFAHGADFTSARFIQKADFSGATFEEEASFAYATFDKGADFTGTTFTREVGFVRAQFGPPETEAVPARTITADLFHSLPCAAFYAARFLKPAESSFFQVNNRRREGLRARLVNCEEIDRLDFTDVHWLTLGRRIVLQDEIDVRVGYVTQHEIVAKAYRQLMSNFEKARAYDLAEDCFVGAMEMKRLNPQSHLLGPMGRWLSTTSLYRLLSNYGSSYARAFSCMIALFLFFALLFPVFGLKQVVGPAPSHVHQAGASATESLISWKLAFAGPNKRRDIWRTFEGGFWTSLEVATFRKNPTLKPSDARGEHLADFEIIVIPGQLALFLLALRRRFRR